MKKKNMKKIMSILFLAVLASCSSNVDFEKGVQQLKQQGYTDAENTGYNFFCCDEKDQFSTGFKAKDKNGNEISGCFCSGLLKGVTIRFE